MRFHNSLPVPPEDPVGPVAPVPPDDPVGPVPPVPPVGPPGPVDPVFPIGPVDPVCPVWPVEPIIRKEIVRQTSVRVIKNCHHFLINMHAMKLRVQALRAALASGARGALPLVGGAS